MDKFESKRAALNFVPQQITEEKFQYKKKHDTLSFCSTQAKSPRNARENFHVN